MKTKFLYLLTAAFALGTAGCKEGGEGPTPKPDPVTLDIRYRGLLDNELTVEDISAEGYEFTVSVTSNRDWKFVEGEGDVFTGLAVSPESGAANETVSVTISVPACTADDMPASGDDDNENLRRKKLLFRTVPRDGEESLMRTVTISQLADGGVKSEVIALETSRMEYALDRHGNGTGSYWLAFQFDNEDGTRSEINLECISDFAQDFLLAEPAAGTYEFADTGAKFTITEYSEFIPDVSIYREHLKITAGRVTIEREVAGDYIVKMDITASNGENSVELAAEYCGAIYPVFFAEVDGDRTGLTDWNEVAVERFKGSGGMWEIVMGNTVDGTSLRLVINTEADLETPPTGSFPMAAAARAGQAGTTEPASMYEFDDYSWGCWYHGIYDTQEHVTVDYPNLQYGVPGRGGVDIAKEGDLYTFTFSFEGPDGHVVSGSCRKEIRTVDPNSFSIDFTSAKNGGYIDTNPMIEFLWDGAADGEKLTLDMYVQANPPQMIPDGTYTFIRQYDVVGTFSHYSSLVTGTGQGQKSFTPDGGTATFTKTAGGYRVVFDIHFEDGRTLKCTYEGPIAES